jgi:hypothetical protein
LAVFPRNNTGGFLNVKDAPGSYLGLIELKRESATAFMFGWFL